MKHIRTSHDTISAYTGIDAIVVAVPYSAVCATVDTKRIYLSPTEARELAAALLASATELESRSK